MKIESTAPVACHLSTPFLSGYAKSSTHEVRLKYSLVVSYGENNFAETPSELQSLL